MSGTASRFQGRFPYAPGLMIGRYPLAAPERPAPALPAGVSTVRAAPVMGVTAPAPAAPAVQAGSVDSNLLRNLMMDGAGGSAQAGYGGPGPSGAPGTGNFGADLAGFVGDRDVQALSAGILGGPMGLVSTVGGIMASGISPRAAGLFGLSAPVGYDPNRAEGPGASVSAPVGIGAFGTPGLGEAPEGGYGTPGVSVKGDNFGASFGPSESPDKGASVGAGDKGDGAGESGAPGTPGAGDNANSNSEAGAADAAGPGEWMGGGYTGPGHPTEPAGTVHKGEVVIPAGQVQRYGLAPLLMLARGQVEPSRLSALLRL